MSESSCFGSALINYEIKLPLDIRVIKIDNKIANIICNLIETYPLLSNWPVGAQVGHVGPVANPVGMNSKMSERRMEYDTNGKFEIFYHFFI